MTHFTPTDKPTFRATLIDGRLYVVPWAPWLAFGGPRLCLASQTMGAMAVVDLVVARESDPWEVIGKPVTGDCRALLEPLSDWGATLGYRRLWLADTVVDLGLPEGPKPYGTRCPTCRAEWVDQSPEFWQASVRAGMFPAFCWVCGGVMAQWQAWPAEAPGREKPEALAETHSAAG